jgi:hypothetical protein
MKELLEVELKTPEKQEQLHSQSAFMMSDEAIRCYNERLLSLSSRCNSKTKLIS